MCSSSGVVKVYMRRTYTAIIFGLITDIFHILALFYTFLVLLGFSLNMYLNSS